MVMMYMAVFISLYLQGILKYTPLPERSGRRPVRVRPGHGRRDRLQTVADGAAALARHGRRSGDLRGLHVRVVHRHRRPGVLPEHRAAVVVIGFGVGLAVIPLTLCRLSRV